MIAFKIKGGRPCFYQWDVNQRLIVTGLQEGDEVHFATSSTEVADPLKVEAQHDGELTVKVPNKLLRESGVLKTYAYVYDENGDYTKYSRNFMVIARERPDTYVYTETDALTWASLDERLKKVEESGDDIGGITDAARALLISVLRNAVFTTDQSANITTLNTELAKTATDGSGDSGGDDSGETETTTYTIVNSLENVENSNTATSAAENSVYTATLAGVGDYSISSVSVTMGGVDITASAWNEADSTITIGAVTGDIIITATGKIVQTEVLEIVRTTIYPSITDFTYTEGSGNVPYYIAKQVETTGGVLSCDFNPEECSGWDLNVFLFDADGNPYKHSYSGTTFNGETEPIYADPGAGDGFGNVPGLFTVQIPDGCTIMVNFRRNAGTGTEVTSNAQFGTWVESGAIIFTVTA